MYQVRVRVRVCTLCVSLLVGLAARSLATKISHQLQSRRKRSQIINIIKYDDYYYFDSLIVMIIDWSISYTNSNSKRHNLLTIMAGGTKRMSAEEKRKVILDIYHSTKTVYTEKEIILALATKAGVNAGT